jgi:hypothetical protein
MLAVDPSLPPAVSGRVLLLLGEALRRKAYYLVHRQGLRGLVSTEVTVHLLTQRLVEQFGFATTGIYLGWTPYWAERLRSVPAERTHRPRSPTVQMSALRRSETVSVVLHEKLISPYIVALPHSFEKLLRELYMTVKLPARFVGGVPPSGASVLAEEVDLRRNRAVVELISVGEDAADLLLHRLGQYRSGLVDLVHFALPLTEVDIEPVVTALLADGVQFAALLPLYRGHDVLMLQAVNAPFVPLTVDDLHSAFAKTLFRTVVAPLQATCRVATALP